MHSRTALALAVAAGLLLAVAAQGIAVSVPAATADDSAEDSSELTTLRQRVAELEAEALDHDLTMNRNVLELMHSLGGKQSRCPHRQQMKAAMMEDESVRQAAAAVEAVATSCLASVRNNCPDMPEDADVTPIALQECLSLNWAAVEQQCKDDLFTLSSVERSTRSARREAASHARMRNFAHTINTCQADLKALCGITVDKVEPLAPVASSTTGSAGTVVGTVGTITITDSIPADEEPASTPVRLPEDGEFTDGVTHDVDVADSAAATDEAEDAEAADLESEEDEEDDEEEEDAESAAGTTRRLLRHKRPFHGKKRGSKKHERRNQESKQGHMMHHSKHGKHGKHGEQGKHGKHGEHGSAHGSRSHGSHGPRSGHPGPHGPHGGRPGPHGGRPGPHGPHGGRPGRHGPPGPHGPHGMHHPDLPTWAAPLGQRIKQCLMTHMDEVTYQCRSAMKQDRKKMASAHGGMGMGMSMDSEDDMMRPPMGGDYEDEEGNWNHPSWRSYHGRRHHGGPIVILVGVVALLATCCCIRRCRRRKMLRRRLAAAAAAAASGAETKAPATIVQGILVRPGNDVDQYAPAQGVATTGQSVMYMPVATAEN